jgi:putative transposase
MATTTRTQRRYDHRLRDLARATRDIDYAIRRGVPRSTARSWLTHPNVEVVTVDVLNMNTIQLQQEVFAASRSG